MRIHVPAIGARFISGLSSSYSSEYPSSLRGVMSESEWKDVVSRLNDTLLSHWPCDVCYIFGVALAPCSCGLSLLAPQTCANDAKTHAEDLLLQHTLRACNLEKGISFRIEYGWCNSWLLITVPDELIIGESDIESVPLILKNVDTKKVS
jgi:hypothetical protein